MEGDGRRLVNFRWCRKCEFRHLAETREPCRYCLEIGGREDGTDKPVYFKAMDTSKDKSDPVRFTPEPPFDPNQGLDEL